MEGGQLYNDVGMVFDIDYDCRHRFASVFDIIDYGTNDLRTPAMVNHSHSQNFDLRPSALTLCHQCHQTTKHRISAQI